MATAFLYWSGPLVAVVCFIVVKYYLLPALFGCWVIILPSIDGEFRFLTYHGAIRYRDRSIDPYLRGVRGRRPIFRPGLFKR